MNIQPGPEKKNHCCYKKKRVQFKISYWRKDKYKVSSILLHVADLLETHLLAEVDPQDGKSLHVLFVQCTMALQLHFFEWPEKILINTSLFNIGSFPTSSKAFPCSYFKLTFLAKVRQLMP